MKVIGLQTIPLDCVDVGGTRKLIEGILGIKPIYEMYDRVADEIAPQARLLLSPATEAPPVVLYFEVEDVRQAAEELRAGMPQRSISGLDDDRQNTTKLLITLLNRGG